MNALENRKILFQTACAAIVADGKIDDSEITELRYIDESTPYFDDLDLSSDIDAFLERYNNVGEKVLDEAIGVINKATLSPVTQLLLLEIVLRIIYADEKIEEGEIEFIRKIRQSLPISDDIVIQRFGKLEILFGSSFDQIKNSDQAIKAIKEQRRDTTDFGSMYHPVPGKKD